MAKKRKNCKKYTHGISEYIVAEDGRMYRVDWRKWGRRAKTAGRGVGRGAVGTARAVKGSALAVDTVFQTVTPATRQALIARATPHVQNIRSIPSELDRRLASFIAGNDMSPYIQAVKNSPSAVDQRLASFIAGGKMPRELPSHIEDEDGRMYRIDWKKTARFAMGGAAVGMAAAGGVAGYHVGSDINAGEYSGLVTVGSTMVGSAYGLASPYYASEISKKIRSKRNKGMDDLDDLENQEVSPMYRATPEYMMTNDRFMYPFSGDTADAIGTDYGISKYTNKKRKKEDVFDDGEDIIALANSDAGVTKYYRSLPEPIMPPSIITPAFGGKKRPKPPGFMPRMPGQKRRRR